MLPGIDASIILLLFHCSQVEPVQDFMQKEDRKLPRYKDFIEINKGITDLVDGDIIPSKTTSRNTISEQSKFWTPSSIPISYGSDLSTEARSTIELIRQEFRLRTCLDFVNRTNEADYISFQSYDGCSSSVGKVGGEQIVSLGPGCESIGIVSHEMMHTIGVFHEQSRTDRDDYVQIMENEITAGDVLTFQKYSYDVLDPRRVPYDYSSVMHFDQHAFSEAGNPTIVTRHPNFQNVIGQRNGFSVGDIEKINKMYGCSDTLLYSYNCNFDDTAACGYTNDYSDDIDWIWYSVENGNATVPSNVPSLDATLGNPNEGAYLVLDTTGRTASMVGATRSMRYETKSSEQCLQFSYFITKDTSSNAAVTVAIGSLDNAYGDITSTATVATLSEDTAGNWQLWRMTISAPSEYRLVFTGATNTGTYEDIFAIDDVSVVDKPCDDAYFVIYSYSQVSGNHGPGNSFLSDVMSTSQGYNFRIELYPQGSSDAEYMDINFGLVRGPDDDTLDWPFENKYIRIIVIDQSKDPLHALSKSDGFLVNATSDGDIWNKPTSDISAGYKGFTNYMRVSDLQNTNSYLRLDRLVISVLIQDMEGTTNDISQTTSATTATSTSTTTSTSTSTTTTSTTTSGGSRASTDSVSTFLFFPITLISVHLLCVCGD